jgi:predicted nicotinamide N-methyase
MAKKKKKDKQTARQAYGITVLKAADPRIRKLKKDYTPFIHGNKFWNSSWCVMDFLARQGLPQEANVLEIGCGWGLAGMYCAKNHGANVLGMDADSAVFPYLKLHAEINDVEVGTWRCKFEKVKKKDLKGTNLILGADICFWDDMVDPVYKLIKKAMKVGVGQVIVADPGRPPFHALSEKVVKKFGGEVKEWEVDEEIKAEAYLLIAGSLP